jgi:hypothetical protein
VPLRDFLFTIRSDGIEATCPANDKARGAKNIFESILAKWFARFTACTTTAHLAIVHSLMFGMYDDADYCDLGDDLGMWSFENEF